MHESRKGTVGTGAEGTQAYQPQPPAPTGGRFFLASSPPSPGSEQTKKTHLPGWTWDSPGHCLQQSEGLRRTGLVQLRRGHCTFSQCTSPVAPCGETMGWRRAAMESFAIVGTSPGRGARNWAILGPPALGSPSWGNAWSVASSHGTLQVQTAHLMRPKGGTTGCHWVPAPRHVLSPSK